MQASRPAMMLVGSAALLAPALHTVTDLMEWHDQGFTDAQLWLNLVAFLPMPLLLLGIHAVQAPRPGRAGLLGALLYGVAFVYFLYTTIYALAEHVPSYEALWAHLGTTYTFFGGLMVGGGLLFGWSAFRAGWLPRLAVLLFVLGLVVNLVLALLPAPDLLQTVGSAMRNVGLMGMGYAILVKAAATTPPAERHTLDARTRGAWLLAASAVALSVASAVALILLASAAVTSSSIRNPLSAFVQPGVAVWWLVLGGPFRTAPTSFAGIALAAAANAALWWLLGWFLAVIVRTVVRMLAASRP